MNDILSNGTYDGLNDEQRKVAMCKHNRILVLAAAGTGKTTTCAAWAAARISEGISPEKLLMLTFTRAAAAEMKERVSIKTGLPSSILQAGTYHSIACRLIREDPQGFGLPENFTIIDDKDSKATIKEAAEQCGEYNPDFGNLNFREIGKMISKSRNRLIPVWISYFNRDAKIQGSPAYHGIYPKNSEEGPVAERILSEYRRILQKQGCLDFDGILEVWHNRLQYDKEYANALREKWSHVLVDEVQDNNKLNQSIIDHLNPETMLAVGDKQQAIYAFRGAAPEIVDELHDRCKILRLSTNYRCSQNVLSLSNRIIAKFPGDESLKVFMDAGTAIDGKTRAFRFEDAGSESSAAVMWVQRQIENGSSPSSIAILSRASSTLAPIEGELMKAGIPYLKRGGSSLSDRDEIKDFSALLRCIFNSSDTTAIKHLAGLFTNIGEKRAEVISKAPWQMEILCSEMYEMIEHCKELSTETLFSTADEIMRPLIENNYDHEEVDERLRHLKVLGIQFAKESLSTVVDAFVVSESNPSESKDHVVLSTIHSAKGLEWDHVWLAGVGSRQLPVMRKGEDLEADCEDQRLLYVATTRARRNLVISYPLIHRRKEQEASRFLPEEVPFTDIVSERVGMAAYEDRARDGLVI